MSKTIPLYIAIITLRFTIHYYDPKMRWKLCIDTKGAV